MFRLWRWFLAALVLIGFFLSSENVRTYWKKKQQLKRMEKNLAQIREQNQQLSMEIQRIKMDPRIIEQYARTELGLIQPGEIEYRFMVKRSTH